MSPLEIDIIPSVAGHVYDMAPRMRKADRDEVWASSRVGPHGALFRAMEITASPKTVLVNGDVVSMFGVASATVLSDYGVPWLLGTEMLTCHPLIFLKGSRDYLKTIRSRYRQLENYVDARNVGSVQWLRWLGFNIDEPKPYGPFGQGFHRFWV